MKKINEWLAAKLTLLVSTMGCVYLFTIWALIPAVFPNARDVVFYVSGGILQLSLLPLIMVGQNVLNRNSEVRAEEDHKAVMAILADIQLLIAQDKAIEDAQGVEIDDLIKLDIRLDRIEKTPRPI